MQWNSEQDKEVSYRTLYKRVSSTRGVWPVLQDVLREEVASVVKQHHPVSPTGVRLLWRHFGADGVRAAQEVLQCGKGPLPVHAFEVVERLRGAIIGAFPVCYIGVLEWDKAGTWHFGTRQWSDVWGEEVAYLVGDWRIILYKDDDGCDYVDSAFTPDGRGAMYPDWTYPNEPLDLFSRGRPADYAKLMQLLAAAPLCKEEERLWRPSRSPA